MKIVYGFQTGTLARDPLKQLRSKGLDVDYHMIYDWLVKALKENDERGIDAVVLDPFTYIGRLYEYGNDIHKALNLIVSEISRCLDNQRIPLILYTVPPDDIDMSELEALDGVAAVVNRDTERIPVLLEVLSEKVGKEQV